MAVSVGTVVRRRMHSSASWGLLRDSSSNVTHAKPFGRQQGRGFSRSTTCMALKTGIVGLPNVGKSTLFNALCEGAQAQAANFPFCTIEPNSGTVAVPDKRLDILAGIGGSARIIPTTVEFVDIAGLVKGASKGEGLGNKFLAKIRECDSIVQVVRCFEDDDVVHVAGKVNPIEDTDVINFELVLADIGQIEKRQQRLGKGNSRSKGKDDASTEEAEAATLVKIMAVLDQNLPASEAKLTEEEEDLVRNLFLLTKKPVTYAANVSEDDLADEGASNPHVKALREKAATEGRSVVIVSAQVEAELKELSAEESSEYLESLGAKEGGLESLIAAAYTQLGLRTYFTVGPKEARAWTITAGMTAPQAAAVIHTDFEKAFIRAETFGFDDLVAAGSEKAAKDNGKLKIEGKDYVVKEGDVILFRTSA